MSQTWNLNIHAIFDRLFNQSGIATIVDDDLSADFILDGSIVSVSLPSVAFSQTANAGKSGEGKSSRSRSRHRKTGKVRWSQSSTKSSEFYVGASSSTSSDEDESGLQFNRVLQDRALEQAGRGVAADLADQFLSARDQGKFRSGTRQANHLLRLVQAFHYFSFSYSGFKTHSAINYDHNLNNGSSHVPVNMLKVVLPMNVQDLQRHIKQNASGTTLFDSRRGSLFSWSSTGNVATSKSRMQYVRDRALRELTSDEYGFRHVSIRCGVWRWDECLWDSWACRRSLIFFFPAAVVCEMGG